MSSSMHNKALRSAPRQPRGSTCTARSSGPGTNRLVNFLNLKRIFKGGESKQMQERNKISSQAPGIFPVSPGTADIIRSINSNEYVHEEARVEWEREGSGPQQQPFLRVKDPKKEKLNNFEKTKMAKNPVLLTLDDFKEWAKVPFEVLDTKENAGDIDIRLKWFGLFHRRKQQYGKFMMRLKLPNGIVTSEQLRVLAEITDEAGEGGCGDITTRQNFQLRGITLQAVPDIFERLEACGLTTIQSGMDNVRNAVGSPIAGVDPMEIVNTIPVCNDLTEYVIDFGKMNERIANLPRKWNVCVVGSHDLYEHPHINDLAYMPAEKDGRFGYNLLVGGFFSATKCEEAISMDAWVPEEHVIHTCDAILTTFRDFGARSGRQKCRMMWLIKDMGLENFRDEVANRMPGGRLETEGKDLVDTSHKRRDYHGVHKQKQEGLNYVGLNVPAGRIQAKDMFEIARLAEEYGSGETRLTVEQNYIIPNVPDDKVEALLQEPLLTTGEGFATAFRPNPGRLVKDLVSCTGNQFCALALIETKATGKALAEALEATMDFTRDVRMHWTGCPNTCGQVQVADIGFLGCQTKNPTGEKGNVDGVKIFLGGNIGHDAALGKEVAKVACSELLPYVQDLLVEKFGATRKSKGSLTSEDEVAIKYWQDFPFNSGGGPAVFPANGNGEYVKPTT
ncbi:ferredoxin-nitrite reductase [Chloropicon primus]|uniref:Ferredoxin--nitrite reductase, chloroplastic n=2 Tax=Chloropicon primus TaxID=1764295 RepID=A0A5B8MH30_9CHLO|nr:ferredoxin-nitrite reductase [Chloropicon primus]UPQ97870.1 ferredoxin-nitrite reductase [Chloropicon primus]|eukprot:QDZ18662.1 ferredoxin-nitrite reductase [Chloropicon primus]